jgi:hypothetical protein
MAQPEPNNNTDMNPHDSEHNRNLNISPNGEALRAPQLNAAITGHGGASSGRQNIGEGGDSDGDSDSSSDGDYDAMSQAVYLNGNVSDDEDDPVDDGQEGVEDMQLDPSQPATPGCPCRCHHGSRRPRDRRLNYSPPHYSGMLTPSSSTLAVRGSSGNSMESSTTWSLPSPIQSEPNFFVNPAFVDETVFPPVNPLRFSLVYSPLALNPVSFFCYPPTLDFQLDSEGEE